MEVEPDRAYGGVSAERSVNAVSGAASPPGAEIATVEADIYNLPDGTKLPKGNWTPLTEATLRDSSRPDPEPEHSGQPEMEPEVKRFHDAALSGAPDQPLHRSVLEFLAKDVPQALSSSLSTRKVQNMLCEDLAVPAQEIENYEEIRAEWPSEEAMRAMSAVELVHLYNRFQEDYPGMIKERLEAEARCDEAEAKAKRDTANLDKQKREREERAARKRGVLVGTRQEHMSDPQQRLRRIQQEPNAASTYKNNAQAAEQDRAGTDTRNSAAADVTIEYAPERVPVTVEEEARGRATAFLDMIECLTPMDIDG